MFHKREGINAPPADSSFRVPPELPPEQWEPHWPKIYYHPNYDFSNNRLVNPGTAAGLMAEIGVPAPDISALIMCVFNPSGTDPAGRYHPNVNGDKVIDIEYSSMPTPFTVTLAHESQHYLDDVNGVLRPAQSHLYRIGGAALGFTGALLGYGGIMTAIATPQEVPALSDIPPVQAAAAGAVMLAGAVAAGSWGKDAGYRAMPAERHAYKTEANAELIEKFAPSIYLPTPARHA